MTKVCFRSELRNYIIYINSFCKLDAVWPCQARGQRLFSGGKFTEVSVWRADCHPDNSNYNNTNTCWVKVFCRWQTLLFGQKCDKDSRGQAGGQTGGQTLLHVQLQYFFLHISYQRLLQLPVTSYWLHVTLVTVWMGQVCSHKPRQVNRDQTCCLHHSEAPEDQTEWDAFCLLKRLMHFKVLPSILTVSSRAAAITAKQKLRPAILQQDRTDNGPDWAQTGLCAVIRSVWLAGQRAGLRTREEVAAEQQEGWREEMEAGITISGPLLSHWIFGSRTLKKEGHSIKLELNTKEGIENKKKFKLGSVMHQIVLLNISVGKAPEFLYCCIHKCHCYYSLKRKNCLIQLSVKWQL